MNLRKLQRQLGIEALPEPFKKLYDELEIDSNKLNGFIWDNDDCSDAEGVFENTIDDDEKLTYFTDNLIMFSCMHYYDFYFWKLKDTPVMEMPIVKIDSGSALLKIEALNFEDFIRLIISDDEYLYEWENEEHIARFRKQIEKILGLLPFSNEEKILRREKIKKIQKKFDNWLIKHDAPDYVLIKESYDSKDTDLPYTTRRELSGDWLIEIMSQPEWSDEVLNVEEICKLDRVEYNGGFTQDIKVKEFDIKLEFSGSDYSEKQRAEAENANLYFQGVSFYENCTIPLPFGLKIGDSRRVVTQKIYEHAKILHLFRWKNSDNFLLEDKDKIYFFKPIYTDDSDKKIIRIVAFVWDITMDLNKNYMPQKISIEEALKE